MLLAALPCGKHVIIEDVFTNSGGVGGHFCAASGFRPGRGHDSPCFHRMRLFTKVLLPSVTEEWLPSSGAQDGEGNGLARILVPRNLRISMLPYPVRGKQKSYSLLRGEAGDGPPLAVCRYTSQLSTPFTRLNSWRSNLS